MLLNGNVRFGIASIKDDSDVYDECKHGYSTCRKCRLLRRRADVSGVSKCEAEYNQETLNIVVIK